MRWEELRGLPVKRLPGKGRSAVYAVTAELRDWVARGGEDQPPPVPQTLTAEAVPEAATGARSAWPWMLPALTVTAALLCVAAVALVRHQRTLQNAELQRTATNSQGRQRHSQVPGVDELYLRGVYYYEQRTGDSLHQAEQNFQQAIALDPGYAPLHAGLANTYLLMREYSGMPDDVAYHKAQREAEKAIALDPNLPEAHVSLGFTEFFYLWQSQAAEQEFKRAIQLDPSSALAHHWYGSMLTHEARYKEALEQLDIAVRLEPTSSANISTRALAWGLSGHRDEAVNILQNVLNASPDMTTPHRAISMLSLMEPRDIPRFLDSSLHVAEIVHDDQWANDLKQEMQAYHAHGETAMWQTKLALEEQQHPKPTDRDYGMIEAEAALGRNDDALRDLDQLVQEHNTASIGIELNPALRPLYGDPRFQRLAAQVGLPPVAGQEH